MILTLFNEILTGDLRPYIGDNRSESYFCNKLALNTTVKSPRRFLKQLGKFLSEHPLLSANQEINLTFDPEGNTIEIGFTEDEIFTPIIGVEYPAFNDTTAYYAHLILREKAEVISKIDNQAQQSHSLKDTRLHLIKVLNEIESLLTTVTKALKKLPNQDIPFYQPTGKESETDRIQMNTHYIFDMVQFTLKELYLMITGSYSEILNGYGRSETELYEDLLQKTSPEMLRLQSQTTFCKMKAKRYTHKDMFKGSEIIATLKDAYELHKKGKLYKPLQETITALENLIFLRGSSNRNNSYHFEDLCSPDFSPHMVKPYIESYKKEVKSLVYGYERMNKLEEISQTLTKLPLEDLDEFKGNYSIPRLLQRWVNFQKALYKDHPSQVFSTTATLLKNNSSLLNPKVKLEKVSLQNQKEIARKYLNFFSGDNIKNTKIMAGEDYLRLLHYVDHLIEHCSVPEKVKSIPQIGVTSEYIRYTFYLIHKELYTTRPVRDYFIDFIHLVFAQFKDISTKTTKTKFSAKPTHYEVDMKNMTK
ncbi:hypothetical protein [Robertkochia sediminum]|uniref:hypothetical protein n=1 Tax=Robertkochia sediminum TaxID=2785326 RepID=UPI00193187B1|nr:hypothetical protein [Robertkochia sediminum]MBL7473086.1 hypothetical protein [Robertkochia sediminum]